MSLHSSAPALLHALRTRCPGDTAPYLNQARATYPGGVFELDAAVHLLHLPDEDLEVSEITVFVEGVDEAPTRPRATNPVYNNTRRTPPYAVLCEAFPREPAWCSALPPATHAPRGWASPHLCPPLSRTRGAHHRGQVLWQERPGTPLLVLFVTTRKESERVLGIGPTHLYGAAPVPRPPLSAPAARDGVHAFLQTQEVTAVTGVHLVRLPSVPPYDPRGPRALSPAPDQELWRDVWAAWLTHHPPQCRWMTTSPRPRGASATAAPPPPPPPSPPQSTARHCPRHTTYARGGSGEDTPAATHAYQDTSDVGLRWLPRAGRPPPPPVPLPLPRLPGIRGGDPRRARGAAAGGGSGAGQAADQGDRLRSPGREPCRPPPGGGPSSAQRAETAAPAGHAAAPSDHAAAPGTPPAQAVASARAPSASPGAAAAATGGREGAKYRAHTNLGHTHTSPPTAYCPKTAFPKGRPRPVRPSAAERTLPGITLPQLQRQQDTRRVIREKGDGAQAGQGAGHRSAERGTGGERGSAQGQAQGTGKERGRRRGQGAEASGSGGGQSTGSGRHDAGHGAGRDHGHGKDMQGREQGAKAGGHRVHGAERGVVAEQGCSQGHGHGHGKDTGTGGTGKDAGDGGRDPRRGQGDKGKWAGKGPKGKGGKPA